MSLDWYVGDVENFEKLCYVETDEGRRLSQLTDGLIWATMHIGMPDITEKNWKEGNKNCQVNLRPPSGGLFFVFSHHHCRFIMYTNLHITTRWV